MDKRDQTIRKRIYEGQLFIWLISVIIFYLMNNLISIQLNWTEISFFSQIRRINDAVLLAIPILLLKRKWSRILWILGVFLFFLSNIWYYRTYGLFIPLLELLELHSIQGLGSSIINSMKRSDIIFPILAVLLIFFIIIKNEKIIPKTQLLTLLCSIFFVTAITASGYLQKEDNNLRSKPSAFDTFFSRAYSQYGFCNYIISQVNNLRPCTNEEINLVDSYCSSNYKSSNICSENAPINNLLLIFIESLSTWELELSLDGQFVMPNLHKLVHSDSVLYYPHCLTQVKAGRSSDCQLMVNTGLLPINCGASANRFNANTFYSLPIALKGKGYQTSIYFSDSQNGWWHQGKNYRQYGYEIIHDNLGIEGNQYFTQDKYIFSKAFSLISQLPEPFLAAILTFSMHESIPFPDHDTIFTNITFPSKELEYSLKRCYLTDYYLNEFIDSLKSNNIFNNTIIVIMGDHYNHGFNEWETRKETILSDFFIPFIIINSHKTDSNTTKVIGQIDIYPTLLDIMGIRDYCWKGLGQNILEENYHSGAVYHNGEQIGIEDDSVYFSKFLMWKISDIIQRSNYFAHHKFD